jgi:hypothetical protein
MPSSVYKLIPLYTNVSPSFSF